jgi:hypothetical protein
VSGSFAAGALTTPKSGRPRAVPLAAEVATVLARLGQRARYIADDYLVFPGELGGYLDGSALRRRYDKARDRAGLRPLRFHDLRHTFGTRMIAKADILRVKEWMGHADVQTTMRYLHYEPRANDARLADEAFALQTPAELSATADGALPPAGQHRGGHAQSVRPGTVSRRARQSPTPRRRCGRSAGDGRPRSTGAVRAGAARTRTPTSAERPAGGRPDRR